jgi:hypothetical protein
VADEDGYLDSDEAGGNIMSRRVSKEVGSLAYLAERLWRFSCDLGALFVD